jgi:hypothetical protein
MPLLERLLFFSTIAEFLIFKKSKCRYFRGQLIRRLCSGSHIEIKGSTYKEKNIRFKNITDKNFNVAKNLEGHPDRVKRRKKIRKRASPLLRNARRQVVKLQDSKKY